MHTLLVRVGGWRWWWAMTERCLRNGYRAGGRISDDLADFREVGGLGLDGLERGGLGMSEGRGRETC